MSYQAIARKWRPRTFEEIAGQDHVKRTLQNALRLQRIHHAYLFTGARGVGKTTAARAMAACLNCENGPTPVPCNECSSCTDVRAGRFPDVVEVDGASNNSVEDIRELRESVHYAPSRGKYRVFIIDEVHMLTKPAFNALLKTLEEPPPHVVFIFATTEPRRIPDTVLSRVQRFDFKRIPVPIVTHRLREICDAEGITISDESLRLIGRAGEGSMRDAQSLLDQVIAFAGESPEDTRVIEILGLVDRSSLFQMLEGLVRGEPHLSLDAIHEVYEHGYDLAQFTSELLELVRNAALVALSPQARPWLDIPEDDCTRLEEICGDLPAQVFSQIFQALLDVQNQVAQSARPRMVLEMAVARLSSTRQVQPVDHLLERLENLERRLQARSVVPRPNTVQQPSSAHGQAPREANHQSAETPPAANTEDEPEPAPEPQAAPTPEPQAAPTPDPAPEPQAAPTPEPPKPSNNASSPAPQPGEPSIAAPTAEASLSDSEMSYQSWLDSFSDSREYRDLVEHSVLVAFDNGVLRIGFDDTRSFNHARELVKRELVLEGAKALFPNLVRLQPELRDDPTLHTRREKRSIAKDAHQKALFDAASSDPLILEACAAFNAKIESVIPIPEQGET